MDYVAFPPPDNLLESFTNARRRQCFDVTVNDDSESEGAEIFRVEAAIDLSQTNFPRVMFPDDADNVTIQILASDGEFS